MLTSHLLISVPVSVIGVSGNGAISPPPLVGRGVDSANATNIPHTTGVLQLEPSNYQVYLASYLVGPHKVLPSLVQRKVHFHIQV